MQIEHVAPFGGSRSASLRAVGYVRVSAKKQEREGQSLEAQRKEISSFCDFRRFELIEVFQDVESAETAIKRKGFQMALAEIYAGRADVLVVHKLDRFARSVVDGISVLQELRASQKDMVCIADPIDTTSPWGEAMFQIMLVFAELERKQTKERCRAGKEFKRSKDGYVYGRPPYGYVAAGKMLVPCLVEQRAIAKILELRGLGWGARRIANCLNERLDLYPRKKKNTKWSLSMVEGIIKNESPLRKWADGKYLAVATDSAQ